MWNFRRTIATRWEELGDSMKFHSQLAEALGTPTEFRLLNRAPPIVVGRRDDTAGADNLKMFHEILSRPCEKGGTPLCRHITESK